MMINPEVERDAVLSADGAYRYWLQRKLANKHTKSAVFIMLNPSTANVTEDDPTIRKCRGFCSRWEVGVFGVINLFACRSTDPRRIRSFADPYGPENDKFQKGAIAEADLVICAWGGGIENGPSKRNPTTNRFPAVERLLRNIGELSQSLQCLGTTKDGEPRHPLMLSYDTPLQEFRP